jgi:hypothetical protein
MNTTNEQQAQIDPANLTFLQIVKALKPIHYGVVIGALASLLSVAYGYGARQSEAENAVKQASLTGENSQCQTVLSIAKQQIATLMQSNAQLTGAANAESVQVGTLRQQLADASVVKAGEANCEFIHGQIRTAEDQIERLRSSDIFGGGGSPDAQTRIQALDTRIADYQAQLGGCGRNAAAELQ